MPISVKTLRRVVPVAAAALLAAGCTSSVSGAPAPETSSSAATSASAANVFGRMDACQVLDQLLSGQGFDPGKRYSKRNECHAQKFDFAVYSMALDPVQGLDEYKTQNPTATPTTVNGRNAMQVTPGEGMCEFALEVSQHARALATVTMAQAQQSAQACPLAQQYAERLEPLLPKS